VKVTIEIDHVDVQQLARMSLDKMSYIENLVWQAVPKLPKKGDKYLFKSEPRPFEVYSCDGVYVLLLSGTRNNRYPHATTMEDFYENWTEA